MDALPLIGEAVSTFDDLGERQLATVARINLAVEQFVAGDPGASATTLRRALDDMRRSGDLTRVNTPLNNLGLALLALGEVEEAEAALLAARPASVDGWERAAVANNLSACLRRLGRLEEAEAALADAEAYEKASGDPSVPGRLALTRLGASEGASNDDRLGLIRTAANVFLATLDLRGLAVTLGFARRDPLSGELRGIRGELEAAIAGIYSGDVSFLCGLDHFPWAIVLFE